MNASYLHLPEGSDLPTIGSDEPFKAVVILEQPTSTAWRDAASDWLVRSGCLYMVAWGRECSAWDDSVDLANVKAFDYGDVPEDRFVMTTWHDNETLIETFWFAEHVALHPTVSLTRTVIIDVGNADRQAQMLETYRTAVKPSTQPE